MRLTDFLDKGASLGPDAPCLTMAGHTRSYAEVQRLSWVIGQALARSGIRPGDKVAVLSANDPVAFSCVFGIARAGAVWCPVNPRNEAAENRELLDLFDCAAPDLPGGVRAAGRADSPGPAEGHHPGLPGPGGAGGHRLRGLGGRPGRRALAGRSGG